MGNRAKRVKLAKRIKELGYGKLYRGSKRVAWRHLYSGKLDELSRKMAFAPGDVANDCDGFNWRIVSWRWERYFFAIWHGKPIRGWYFDVDQFVKENGWFSCGCPSGPDLPQTRQDIEAYLKAYVNDPKLAEQGWINGKFYDALRQRFAAGEHICDEQGVLFPELHKIRLEKYEQHEHYRLGTPKR